MSAPDRFEREPSNPWGLTLFLSVLLHVAGVGVALALPRLLSRPGSGAPVYVVDLVALPAGSPALPAAPAASPSRKESAPPKPEKPVAIPDRKARKPEPKKTPEPKKIDKPDPRKEEPRPAASPSPKGPAAEGAAETQGRKEGPSGATSGAGAPGLRGGGAGGTGTEQADAATFYGNLLRQRIEGAWNKPIYPPAWTSREDPKASVRIGLTSSGRVTATELVAASGYDAMDRSILRAVQDAQPFPPFPYQLGRDSLTVTIDFVLPPK